MEPEETRSTITAWRPSHEKGWLVRLGRHALTQEEWDLLTALQKLERREWLLKGYLVALPNRHFWGRLQAEDCEALARQEFELVQTKLEAAR